MHGAIRQESIDVVLSLPAQVVPAMPGVEDSAWTVGCPMVAGRVAHPASGSSRAAAMMEARSLMAILVARNSEG